LVSAWLASGVPHRPQIKQARRKISVRTMNVIYDTVQCLVCGRNSRIVLGGHILPHLINLGMKELGPLPSEFSITAVPLRQRNCHLHALRMRARCLPQSLQRFPKLHKEAVCVCNREARTPALLQEVLREPTNVAARRPVKWVSPRRGAKYGGPQRRVPLARPAHHEEAEVVEDLVQQRIHCRRINLKFSVRRPQ
jgi:hypothetical protein